MLVEIIVQDRLWKTVIIEGDSYQWGHIVELVYNGYDAGEIKWVSDKSGLKIEARPVT